MNKNIVMEAVVSTLKQGQEGIDWFNGICKKISKDGGTGSYLEMSPEEVERTILGADWEVEDVIADKRAICVAKGIRGGYNMMCLVSGILGDEVELVVEKFHGDKPQLGWVNDVITGTETNELRAVCGIDQDGNGTFFITAFPGPNIEPDAIEVPEEYLGKTITVAEAKRLGASYCKIVTTAAYNAIS